MARRAEYIYVIAGNYQQFRHWCRANGKSPMDRFIRYVRDESILMGAHPDKSEFVFFGDYMGRSDIWDLMATIDMIKAARRSE